jgi:hypothetical protein
LREGEGNQCNQVTRPYWWSPPPPRPRWPAELVAAGRSRSAQAEQDQSHAQECSIRGGCGPARPLSSSKVIRLPMRRADARVGAPRADEPHWTDESSSMRTYVRAWTSYLAACFPETHHAPRAIDARAWNSASSHHSAISYRRFSERPAVSIDPRLLRTRKAEKER